MPENVPLYNDMRVTEYLDYRAALKGVPHRRVAERVGDVKELCGVKDVEKKLIGTLSKGYRQRVGLADARQTGPRPRLFADRQACREAEQRAGQGAADKQVKGAQASFGDAGLDHVGDDVGRFKRIHIPRSSVIQICSSLRVDGPEPSWAAMGNSFARSYSQKRTVAQSCLTISSSSSGRPGAAS